jgi:hypothetical protein
MADDEVGDAAEEEAAHGSAAVTSYDNHVGLLASGRLDDRLAGITLPDEEVDMDAHFAAPRHELLRRSFAAVADLVDAKTRVVSLAYEGARVDDADDEELGAQVMGQVEGLHGGVFGGGREIRREEDATDGADRPGGRGGRILGATGHPPLASEERRGGDTTDHAPMVAVRAERGK